MKIQGRMKEFLRELISERWIKVRMGVSISQSKQTDMGIPQGGVLSDTLSWWQLMVYDPAGW